MIDGATPSGNAVAADVLLRLALLTGDPELDRRARAILRTVAGALDRQPSAFGRMLSVVDRSLGEPVDAVIAGPVDTGAAGALRAAALGPYAPDLVVASMDPAGTADRELAGWALFAGKMASGGEPTAYVCRGYACEAPTTEPGTVRSQVEGLSKARS